MHIQLPSVVSLKGSLITNKQTNKNYQNKKKQKFWSGIWTAEQMSLVAESILILA